MNIPLAFAVASLFAASFPRADACICASRLRAMGLHPDWGLIGLLRGQLADQGYATLSVQMPVLDLYGEKDNPGVLESAPQRAAAIRKVRGSGRIQVAGADHFFTGLEGELVRHVRRFVDQRLK